jgi:hypothetical protein
MEARRRIAAAISTVRRLIQRRQAETILSLKALFGVAIVMGVAASAG